MNRTELKRLVQERLDDAATLLAQDRWSAEYYIAGYAVECALKACLLRHLGESSALFTDRRFAKNMADCWTHDLERLVDLSGLEITLGNARSQNSALNAYWILVKDWDESSRYTTKSEDEARMLFAAISNVPNGVLEWLRMYWWIFASRKAKIFWAD